MRKQVLINLFKKRLEKLKDDYFYYEFATNIIKENNEWKNLKPFHSILLYKGTTFYFNFKTKGRKIIKYQRECLHQAKDAGGIEFVINEKDSIRNVVDVIKNMAENRERKLWRR